MMDLSTYYEDFQLTYNLSIIALCLMIFAVIFIGVRSVIDKKESVKKKVAECLILVLTFACVLNLFLHGPNLAKKDLDQKTIYYYEGDFDIVETSNGIYNKATFLIENKNITLKYYEENEDYEFDSIKPGSYEGEIVYAQNAAKILYMKIYQVKE